MTDILRSKYNELEEVTEWVSEELARTKLIRRGADQDLVQALKSIKDLTTELEATQKENSDLWSTMHHVANLIRVPKDAGKSWVQFFLVIPERFNAYVKTAAKACVRSVLAQIRVLWPTVPLEKLTEDIEDEGVL
jgi:iron-sulfur cluster repair protein YtfE (RIC family)